MAEDSGAIVDVEAVEAIGDGARGNQEMVGGGGSEEEWSGMVEWSGVEWVVVKMMDDVGR